MDHLDRDTLLLRLALARALGDDEAAAVLQTVLDLHDEAASRSDEGSH